MNISQKCNCCIKESVCKYKTEYQCDCEKLKAQMDWILHEVVIKHIDETLKEIIK